MQVKRLLSQLSRDQSTTFRHLTKHAKKDPGLSLFFSFFLAICPSKALSAWFNETIILSLRITLVVRYSLVIQMDYVLGLRVLSHCHPSWAIKSICVYSHWSQKCRMAEMFIESADPDMATCISHKPRSKAEFAWWCGSAYWFWDPAEGSYNFTAGVAGWFLAVQLLNESDVIRSTVTRRDESSRNETGS
jgi:hypothetical protein